MNARRIFLFCGTLALSLAALSVVMTPSDNSSDIQAQEKALEAKPELYTGVVSPASQSNVSNPLKAFSGRVTIEDLSVTNGQVVKKGDLLATLKLHGHEGAVKSAAQKIEEAEYELDKAELGLNHERESREYNVAKAEMDAEAAERKLKNFKSFGKEDKITKAKQRVQGSKDSIENQEDELKQLRKLYGKNELATESQDIVLKRAERRLKVSKRNLKITENEVKVYLESQLPAEEWKLPFDLKRAKRALQKSRIDQREALEKREKSLKSSRKKLKDARSNLEALKGDTERLEIRASADGTVIFGSINDNKGFGEGIRQGGAIKLRQALFSIVDLNTMYAEIEIPVNKRFGFAVGTKGNIPFYGKANHSLEGQVIAISKVAFENRVRVKLKVEAKGLLLVGEEIMFSVE